MTRKFLAACVIGLTAVAGTAAVAAPASAIISWEE